MRNKLYSVLLCLTIITGLIFFQASCKKSPVWDSSKFAGNYMGAETCLLTSPQSSTISIVATSATQISITNLYGLGKSLVGSVSHDTCTIQPQICDTFVMQGILILSSDSLNLAIIASSFGKEDKCNAILIKQ